MGGCCVPFRVGGELGPGLTQCHLGRGLPPYTKWHLDPYSRLAPKDTVRKVGAAVPLSMGVGGWDELCPHLTQCGPSRGLGLPPYQVTS